jgi:hypothetical protein
LAVVRIPGQGANVIVLGTAVSEIWTNVQGQEGYRKNTTVNVDYGCISVSTIARSDIFVAWLAINESNSPVIMIYTGQQFKPISTDGIDYLMGTIQFPTQSTAMFYRQDGHLFYQLTFFNPADDITLLYDVNTDQFFNLSDFAEHYHPAVDYVNFNNNDYMISLNTAGVYQVSTDFTTYNENLPIPNPQNPDINHEIPRTRIPDTIRLDSSQYRVNTFYFIIEQGYDVNVTGIALAGNPDPLITEALFAPPLDIIVTEQGIEIDDEDAGLGIGMGFPGIPYQQRVDLSFSADGGVTWSNTVGRGLNPIGVRKNILNWESMGSCNEWTPKLRFWGTSRFVAYNGFVELF